MDTAAVHLHEDDLELYVQGRLPSDLLATMDSHLSDCPPCCTRISSTLGLTIRSPQKSGARPDELRGRRREPRFSAGDTVTIQELHPLSLNRVNARIVDVSKNGLGVLGTKFIVPGTIVQIRLGTIILVAEVRHCQPQDEGYRLGMRLRQAFWKITD